MLRTLPALLFGCVALIPGAGAGPTAMAWSTPSPQQIDAIYAEVESLYLDLHRSPELAMQETETAAKLAARVRSLGYDVTTGVGGTGVVAVLKNGPGRRDRADNGL
jgi:hippurate hydrolase